MAQKNAANVAKKWQQNFSGSTATVQQGVQSVTVAPGQQAAAAQATMRSRILQAIDSGKWAANVSAVSLQSWQNSMLTTGVPRMADGATKGLPKMQAFMQQWLPFVYNAQQQVKQMPNATPQDRINRMIQNVQLLSQFKKAPGT